MKILLTIIAAALIVSGCQAPLVMNGGPGVPFSLKLNYTNLNMASHVVSSSARLLLPNAGYATVSLTNAVGSVTTLSQTLSGGSSSTFSFPGVVAGRYTITAQAFTSAVSTIPLFTNTISTNIDFKAASVVMDLVPGNPTLIGPSAQNAGSLPAGQSVSFQYNVSSTGNGLKLFNLPAGAAYYLQNSAGKPIVDSAGSVPAGATDGSLLVTLYNPTAGSVPYKFSVIENSVNAGLAQWGISTAIAAAESYLTGVAVDSAGNVAVSGYMTGAVPYRFTGGTNFSGGYAGAYNPLLMKMDPSGAVMWTVSSIGSWDNGFNGVASDSANNLFAVGYISNGYAYNFGSGVSASSINTGGADAVIVKYNVVGIPQWARAATAGGSGNRFQGVAVDAAGNAYAVGYNRSSGTPFKYGGTAQAQTSGTWSLMIVKFDSTGLAQWISTVTTGIQSSFANAVAVDASGNAYLAGTLETTSAFGFGNMPPDNFAAVTCTNSAYNGVLIKYSSNGTPQWSSVPLSNPQETQYIGVATDPAGNSTVVGYLFGGGMQSFGNGQATTGGFSGSNALIVRYNASGIAQWARSVIFGTAFSEFYSVSLDGSGNSYAVGAVTGPGSYDFGNGQVINTPVSGLTVVIVKYNPMGVAQWARTTTTSPATSQFRGVAADFTGNVYAAGFMYGASPYDFGNNISVNGAFAGIPTPPPNNAVVVKYH